MCNLRVYMNNNIKKKACLSCIHVTHNDLCMYQMISTYTAAFMNHIATFTKCLLLAEIQ